MRGRPATVEADASGAEARIDGFAGRDAVEHDIRHLRLERSTQAVDATLPIIEKRDRQIVGPQRGRLLVEFEHVVMTVVHAAAHSAVAALQLILGPFDADLAVSRMGIAADIFVERASRRVGPAPFALGGVVGWAMRNEGAAPLAKPLDPRHRVPSAEMIEHRLGDDIDDRRFPARLVSTVTPQRRSGSRVISVDQPIHPPEWLTTRSPR